MADGATAVLALRDAACGLNGVFHLEGATGEPEENRPEYTVVYPHIGQDVPMPRWVADEENGDMPAGRAESFMLMQYNALAEAVQDPLTRLKIAYVRLWAANAGLFDPASNAEAFFCRYNQSRMATAAEAAALHGMNIADDVVNAANQWADERRKDFADMVCLVAFMFRQRGHHYMADLEQRYIQLWKNCQRDEENPGLAWVHIATHALHAVYPIRLDEFWKFCVENSYCRGALKKRYHCAPAGAALWPALETAWTDLAAAVPGVTDRMQQVKADLDEALAQARAHRWAGSVNRNRYNAPAITVPEERVAALAAVALSMLRVFTPDHELTRSEALKRTARNAPIIGGVISSGVREATRLPSYGQLLLGASADVIN